MYMGQVLIELSIFQQFVILCKFSMYQCHALRYRGFCLIRKSSFIFLHMRDAGCDHAPVNAEAKTLLLCPPPGSAVTYHRHLQLGLFRFLLSLARKPDINMQYPSIRLKDQKCDAVE